MSKPKRLALLTFLAAALTPAAASAGTYTVHSCHTPTGTWVGTRGWVASTPATQAGRDAGTVEACSSQGTAMVVKFGTAQLPTESGVGRSWRVDAAEHTSITGIEVVRRYEVGWIIEEGLYDRAFVVDSWHDEDDVSNRVEFKSPPWGTSIDSTNAGVLRGSGSWASFGIRLRCWEAVGDALCAPFHAGLAIARAKLQITDTSAPTATTSGSLVGSGAVRGTGVVSFDAADAGGGVYRAVLAIDGEEVRREVVDADGGSCGDVEAGNGDAYEFAAPRPCPLSASGSLSFDTRRLTDGQHQARLEIEDAAGNAVVAHDGSFTSSNAPLSTAAPQLGGEARVGRLLTATTGEWAGEPTAVERQWLSCDGSGGGCVALPGENGASYAPDAAVVGRRMVVEVAAENGSGTGTARSAPSSVVADAEVTPEPERPQPRRSTEAPPVLPGPGGIQNPVAGDGGHAPNGDGASARPRLTLGVRVSGGRTVRTARAAASRRWTLTGVLTDGGGRGIAGAQLNVLVRVAGGGWRARGLVRTGAGGRFSYALAAGPTRQVRVAYYPFADSRDHHASSAVTVEALAPLTIRSDRALVTGRRVVTLSGRAGGSGIPAGGLLVTLQGYQRGYGWRTFRTIRTSRSGAWRAQYRFRSTTGRFAFRIVVPRQGRYPYVSTTSASIAVRVA